jgi:hypothetical protein
MRIYLRRLRKPSRRALRSKYIRSSWRWLAVETEAPDLQEVRILQLGLATPATNHPPTGTGSPVEPVDVHPDLTKAASPGVATSAFAGRQPSSRQAHMFEQRVAVRDRWHNLCI